MPSGWRRRGFSPTTGLPLSANRSEGRGRSVLLARRNRGGVSRMFDLYCRRCGAQVGWMPIPDAEFSGCVASEPKLPSTLTHLKPIPVRILEPRDGTPWELEDLGWLELHSAGLQRLETHPAFFPLDGVNA